MMRARALALAGALAFAAGGCGGSETTVEQVPGAPASIPIPSDPASLGGDSGGADSSATPTPTATPAAGTGTAAPSTQSGAAPAGDQGTGVTADSGGGATAPAQQDSPTTDTPPPAGSDAQKFEDFCAQNPGAC